MKLRKIKRIFTKGDFDILLLQETRSDGSDAEYRRWCKVFGTKQIYLTSFGPSSVGAGIVVKCEESFKVDHVFKDPKGRYVGIMGDHEDARFLVLSFYSPSIDNEIREFVSEELITKLHELGKDLPEFLIVGGDTNTVFSAKDKIGGSKAFKTNAIQSFNNMKSRFDLFDSFRVKNPFTQEFSWEVLNPTVIKERIDMIFVSSSLQDYLSDSDIIPPHKTCSDHGIPFIKIKGHGIPCKGPGVWKFNNTLLLEPEFVAEMRQLLPQWVQISENDLPGRFSNQWGYIKHKIGEFSRSFGAKLKKAKIILRTNIEKELSEIAHDVDIETKIKYQNLKKQLDEIIEHEIRGSVLRSLCKDYEEGEKCSEYFFSLEKARSNQKTITCLKTSKGVITDPSAVMEECRQFYKKLYSKNKTVDLSTCSEFLENDSIPKLSNEKKDFCEQVITEQELFATLKKFKKNKSPRLDGLTAEYYLEFWDLLKNKLLEVYNESFNKGALPDTLGTGVIVLIEKKGKDRLDIANWRPITLLGIDYKLLTKTLGERLKKVLPDLIHPDQNGFIPGGNIFYSAHTIRDIMFYCNKENIDLILLALDYTKAFDSLEFSFVHETFRVFNFGDNFRRWIKVIFSGGKSCISNNGFLSATFSIERSTRQGDPISPLIFILALEVLFILIRANSNIKGIRVLKTEVKLTSYADDATYFLKDRPSMENLLDTIEKFSKVSGLEVNKTKSECLILDFEMNLSSHETTILGVPLVDNLKILGHHFGKNKLVCDYHNFYSKLSKYDRIVNIWKQRSLTIFGKNLLINSLLNSLFSFNAQIEDPPVEFIKSIESKNKNFLWDGGVPKIAHHSIIGDFPQGGFRYKDLESFLISVNLKFLMRLRQSRILPNTCIPMYWLMRFFDIPVQYTNADEQYFQNYFQNQQSILDCKIKLPIKSLWGGSSLLFEIIKFI